MARPTLPIGSYGRIAIRPLRDGYEASCRYRDQDGMTRRVSAVGPTRSAAEKNLRATLANRCVGIEGTLTRDSRFAVAAEMWFESITSAAEAQQRSPSTVRVYRTVLDGRVLPALGQLKLREVTTSRVDNFLVTVRDRSGHAVAKTCRSVISGVLKLAMRADAVTRNAAAGTTPLSGKPKKQPRGLAPDERARWLAQLSADPRSVSKDLPDLVSFMLDTGVRIGEALAVTWDQIDFEAATVEISYTVIRVKGQGLLRKSTKTAAGIRVLPLPPSTVVMLRRRRRAGRIGTTPVFPGFRGSWRDPTNTSRDLRNARGTEEFSWVTSHVFRKTAATMLDEAGMSARDIANHMGHSKISMTQDHYLSRTVTNRRAAEVLGEGTSGT